MPDYFPPEFSELERFGTMAYATEAERVRAKLGRSYADSKAFYDAVRPRLDEILAFLAKFQLGAMPPEVERLRWLVLSLADVAPAVDHWEGYAGASQVGGRPHTEHPIDAADSWDIRAQEGR